MITLKISLLLAVDLNQKKQTSPKEPKKSKSGASESVSKKKTKEKSKLQPVPDDANCTAIEVNDPLDYYHIEYELFPKIFKYVVDVVLWGPVAKIFSKSGIKCVKTFQRDNIVWIPIFIEHYLQALPTEEIRLLLKEVLTFNITSSQNDVSQKAKSDKTSVFYLYKKDADAVFFPEVYIDRPKDKTAFIRKEVERILEKLQTVPSQNEIVTWIYNIDEAHAQKMSKIIEKRFLGEEIPCKDFHVEENHNNKKSAKDSMNIKKKSSKKVNSKKSTKSSSTKSKNSDVKIKMSVKIPAHVLLSDSQAATYKLLKNDPTSPEIYILLGSSCMLSTKQKQELLPLVVKICKISNLPADILEQNNCIVPGFTEFRTALRPICDTVKFDESQIIITSDFPQIKTVELLQTNRVFIKIMGSKERCLVKTENSEDDNSSVKDKKKKHEKLTKSNGQLKSNHQEEEENIVLAVASFDLSPLTKNFFLFREKGQCYNPSSISFEKEKPFRDYFFDYFTINESNQVQMENVIRSPLNDGVMFRKGTSIKFEAHFLQPTYPLFYIKDNSSTYRRFLIVFFKRDIAEDFLGSILTHNYYFAGVKHFPRMIAKRTESIHGKNDERLLSGFVVDDGNGFIFYVEGSSNGCILKFLHAISGFSSDDARVFYNSEYIFEERLYSTFHSNGGVALFTLKVPLKEIFARPEIYVRGNVPPACFRALEKLILITNSSSFKSILNQRLMPTEIELLSLSYEFGFYVKYDDSLLLPNYNSEQFIKNRSVAQEVANN